MGSHSSNVRHLLGHFQFVTANYTTFEDIFNAIIGFYRDKVTQRNFPDEKDTMLFLLPRKNNVKAETVEPYEDVINWGKKSYCG